MVLLSLEAGQMPALPDSVHTSHTFKNSKTGTKFTQKSAENRCP